MARYRVEKNILVIIGDTGIEESYIHNITPHPVKLQWGDTWVEIPGIPIEFPRVEEKRIPARMIGMLRLNFKSLGQINGLPEPLPGHMFIVPTLIASALRGERDDLLVPDELVRDENGHIIGAGALAILK